MIAIGVAIGVAGCGGDSDAGSATTKDLSTVPRIGLPVFTGPLTKAQFLAKANARCRETWPNMRQELADYQREPGLSAEDSFARASKESFLPHIQFWFDDISFYGSPKGDERRVEDVLKTLQWAVYSGQERRVSSPDTLAALFGSFNRLARAYGLDSCVVDENAFQGAFAS